jgi:hypothetical protein
LNFNIWLFVNQGGFSTETKTFPFLFLVKMEFRVRWMQTARSVSEVICAESRIWPSPPHPKSSDWTRKNDWQGVEIELRHSDTSIC